MAITTYSELKTAVANWLDRSDLTDRIPECIALWEAYVNRVLRVRQQITTTTLSPSSGSASLPSDYLEWKRLTWQGSPRVELQYVDPDWFQAAYTENSSDEPSIFTIEGSSVLINSTSTTSIIMAYAQKVPALTDSATTNWLLTAHPDVYLYGTLKCAATFTEDKQTGPIWDALAKEALDQVLKLSFSSRGPQRVRTYGVTP